MEGQHDDNSKGPRETSGLDRGLGNIVSPFNSENLFTPLSDEAFLKVLQSLFTEEDKLDAIAVTSQASLREARERLLQSRDPAIIHFRRVGVEPPSGGKQEIPREPRAIVESDLDILVGAINDPNKTVDDVASIVNSMKSTKSSYSASSSGKRSRRSTVGEVSVGSLGSSGESFGESTTSSNFKSTDDNSSSIGSTGGNTINTHSGTSETGTDDLVSVVNDGSCPDCGAFHSAMITECKAISHNFAICTRCGLYTHSADMCEFMGFGSGLAREQRDNINGSVLRDVVSARKTIAKDYVEHVYNADLLKSGIRSRMNKEELENGVKIAKSDMMSRDNDLLLEVVEREAIFKHREDKIKKMVEMQAQRELTADEYQHFVHVQRDKHRRAQDEKTFELQAQYATMSEQSDIVRLNRDQYVDLKRQQAITEKELLKTVKEVEEAYNKIERQSDEAAKLAVAHGVSKLSSVDDWYYRPDATSLLTLLLAFMQSSDRKAVIDCLFYCAKLWFEVAFDRFHFVSVVVLNVLMCFWLLSTFFVTYSYAMVQDLRSLHGLWMFALFLLIEFVNFWFLRWYGWYIWSHIDFYVCYHSQFDLNDAVVMNTGKSTLMSGVEKKIRNAVVLKHHVITAVHVYDYKDLSHGKRFHLNRQSNSVEWNMLVETLPNTTMSIDNAATSNVHLTKRSFKVDVDVHDALLNYPDIYSGTLRAALFVSLCARADRLTLTDSVKRNVFRLENLLNYVANSDRYQLTDVSVYRRLENFLSLVL